MQMSRLHCETLAFSRPFELLVNTYARPRYEEIDPTILIAITFPLLYGAMFGDVGHGLVLAAIGWFLSAGQAWAGYWLPVA